jgi:hypothetical protein
MPLTGVTASPSITMPSSSLPDTTFPSVAPSPPIVLTPLPTPTLTPTPSGSAASPSASVPIRLPRTVFHPPSSRRTPVALPEMTLPEAEPPTWLSSPATQTPISLPRSTVVAGSLPIVLP